MKRFGRWIGLHLLQWLAPQLGYATMPIPMTTALHDSLRDLDQVLCTSGALNDGTLRRCHAHTSLRQIANRLTTDFQAGLRTLSPKEEP